ncbi:TraB/GumN family protein [Microvirga sp. W0021]|uniref:TraB/GumN family protein n=1 Tax=Hohaiivirga grylli TaxID=3133970 RepID=A0ABV0BMI4_9HYPH
MNTIRLLCSLLVLAGLVTQAKAECVGKSLFSEWQKKHPEIIQAIEARSVQMPFTKGKFFKITKDGQRPSYVLGTIHVHDERYIPLNPKILAALNETELTALELAQIGQIGFEDMDLSDENPEEIMFWSLAESGERPLDFLSAEEQLKLKNYVKEDSFSSVSLMLVSRPVNVALQLASMPCGKFPDPKITPGVDDSLAHATRQAGRRVVGLEKISEQLKLLNDVPLHIQQEMLRSQIRAFPYSSDLLETAKQLYLSDDIGKLIAIMELDHPLFVEKYGHYPEEIMEKLLNVRNAIMVDRLLPLLKDKSVFVAVGAGHLPGEYGLLKLLEEQGYKIERIDIN